MTGWHGKHWPLLWYDESQDLFVQAGMKLGISWTHNRNGNVCLCLLEYVAPSVGNIKEGKSHVSHRYCGIVIVAHIVRWK
jgi:hypothetical protein